MNKAIAINDSVYWIGINDRETHLFESMWPIPRGIAYNSYIIIDEKIALIDTVKAPYQTDYLEKIREVTGGRPVDYLIINHMEPDHSGAIRGMREVFPDMEIVGNKKTMEFLQGFYGITDKTKIITDGEELSLGTHTLKFYITPMVHWPETMMTFDQQDGILFSGDAFGGFGTLDGGIFDDELNMQFFEDETLRYFSNIVGKYSTMVQKAIEKLKDLPVKIVAATHGPILRKNPQKIIDDYYRWSKIETEEGAVVVYGSMYGNTKKMAEEIARSLAANGIEKIVMYDLSKTHMSFIISSMWRYRGIVLGSCTYDMKAFPLMENLLRFFEKIPMKNHLLGIFGTYSWSGGAVKRLKEFAENGNWNLVEPVVEAKFSPDGEHLKDCASLGKSMAERIKG